MCGGLGIIGGSGSVSAGRNNPSTASIWMEGDTVYPQRGLDLGTIIVPINNPSSTRETVYVDFEAEVVKDVGSGWVDEPDSGYVRETKEMNVGDQFVSLEPNEFKYARFGWAPDSSWGTHVYGLTVTLQSDSGRTGFLGSAEYYDHASLNGAFSVVLDGCAEAAACEVPRTPVVYILDHM